MPPLCPQGPGQTEGPAAGGRALAGGREGPPGGPL